MHTALRIGRIHTSPALVIKIGVELIHLAVSWNNLERFDLQNGLDAELSAMLQEQPFWLLLQ